MLTFEVSKDSSNIQIYLDASGLELLEKILKNLKDKKDTHYHLMTPSWSGNELTEELQGDDTILINQVTVLFSE